MFWLECQYSGSALLGFNRQTSSYFLHTGIIKSGKKMVISSGIVWMRILVLFWYCFWNQNWVRNFVGLCINIVRFWYLKLFHSSGKKKEFNFFMVEVPIILKPVHWIFFPYSVRIRGKMGKKKLYLNTSYDAQNCFLRIWSNLLKKCLLENFIFCEVHHPPMQISH